MWTVHWVWFWSDGDLCSQFQIWTTADLYSTNCSSTSPVIVLDMARLAYSTLWKEFFQMPNDAYWILILHVQPIEYHLQLDRVTIDGDERIWRSVFLAKYVRQSLFIFQDAELSRRCDGVFPSTDVEIVKLFGNEIRFCLMGGMNQLFFNLSFTQQGSVPLFFGDIRSKQKKVINH